MLFKLMDASLKQEVMMMFTSCLDASYFHFQILKLKDFIY